MKVILVPVRLQLAAGFLFFCIPLAAIETVIVTRAPWWHLPYRSIGIWSFAVLLICLPLIAWLIRGKRWALFLTSQFFATWLILNVWVAGRMRHPVLGFYTLFLLAFFGLVFFWLRHELGRSFFDPRLKWYHGMPKPLPGLNCTVSWGDGEVSCRVSRLDREGAFIFRNLTGERSPLSKLRPGIRSELTFFFRERQVKCTAMPMRALEGNEGVGFQFLGLAPDTRKQLGDFIETLKGEGYVF